MSDLIISINFDESKKKNRLVVETYEGSIPKYKSKRYSGQLRNLNISEQHLYDNIQATELEKVKQFLRMPGNVQISKYQYLILAKNIWSIDELVSGNYLFYKEKKQGMFQIEQIFIGKLEKENFFEIAGMKFQGKRNCVFFELCNQKESENLIDIIPKAYIDIRQKTYALELVFEYDDKVVNYSNKERELDNNNSYRDYRFEERTRQIVENNGWEYKKAEGFVYGSKSIANDINELISAGIKVYTNKGHNISAADFSSIRVSYNMDWFGIEGNVKAGESIIEVSELLNLKKRNDLWVEYNGKILFLPEVFNKKNIKFDSEHNSFGFEKKGILSAMEMADSINHSTVKNIEALIAYDNVQYGIGVKIDKMLRPYQRDGVKWLLSLYDNGFGACLADDMGLGKTLQTIAYLSDARFRKSCNLIVVPKTLLLNWEREFTKFDSESKVCIYHGNERNYVNIRDYKIVLTTYRTLMNDVDLFDEYTFDNLILDEAQTVKNSKSKAYRAIMRINAGMRIILTGTPIENNLNEFWGLMRLINPEAIGSLAYYSKEIVDDITKIRELTSPFLLRRLKQDVLKELPIKQEQVVYVKMEDSQRALYDKVLESIRYEILRKSERYEIKSNSIMLTGLLYLQQICCHPRLLSHEYNMDNCNDSIKMDTLMDLLDGLITNGHKVVIFSRFTKMLKILERRLAADHRVWFYLDGKTKDRMGVIDSFENSNEGVFLISLKAGGTGVNLTSADTVIIYDPWWNPASEKQAEDRVYRIGQEKNVMVYKLIVENTIEEKIQQLQNEKKNLSAQIIEGHSMPTSLTMEVIENLIMG